MPIFTIEYLKAGAKLPLDNLPSKGDVVKLFRLLRQENPSVKKYTKIQLINDLRDAILDSYKRLHHQLQGPVLRGQSSIYTKIDNLVKAATKVINKIATKQGSKDFLQDSVELFDILACR